MSLLAWRLIVYGGLILAAMGFTAYEVYQHEERKVRVEHDERITFQAGVEALGRARQAQTDKENAANLKRKQDADAENGKTQAKLAAAYDAYNQLLNSPGAYRRVLPGPGAETGSSTVLTFDRAALDRGMEAADGVLQSGAAKILYRGDKAITDLNTAKRWAKP